MLKFIQNVSGENSGYPRSHHMVDMGMGTIAQSEKYFIVLHVYKQVHVNEGWMIQDHIAKVP